MGLRNTLAVITSIAYIVALPTLADMTSVTIAAIPAAAMLVWVATDDITRLPAAPTLMTLIGGIALGVAGALFVAQQATGLFQYLGYIIGFAGGAVAFFIGTGFARQIAASILGVDLEQHEQERKREKTNDPYGDKHAAKILNDQ